MATLSKALTDKLASAGEHDHLEIDVFLTGSPADAALSPATLSHDRTDRVNAITSAAQQLQHGLLGFLEGEGQRVLPVPGGLSVPAVVGTKAFWINNAVTTRAVPEVVRRLSERGDVMRIDLSRTAMLDELLDTAVVSEHRLIRRVSRLLGTSRTALFNLFKVKADASVEQAPTDSVQKLGAPGLWKLGHEGDGVLVAVIDTGVNYNHPDLAGRMWDGGTDWPHHGRDFEGNDKDPMDEKGHGTLSAGLVAGTGASGIITGTAPKATLMALRVGTNQHDYWDAFQFATSQHAHIISMSITWKKSDDTDTDYPGWRRVCETLLAAGVLHVNSSGNEGNKKGRHRDPVPCNIGAPADCPPPRLHPLQTLVGGLASAITCGGTTINDELDELASAGPVAWETAPYADYPYQNGQQQGLIKPDVCAPTETTSCYIHFEDTIYSPTSGTSSAAPAVAGCVALLVSACLAAGKPIVAANIQEALEGTAARIVGQSKAKENNYGAGRVDVAAAYQYGRDRSWW